MQTLRSADEIRDVNTRYHDVAAGSYDHKWGIDFGQTGRTQTLRKLRKLIGPDADAGFGDVLEVGAGTGYFSLNLAAAGVIRHLTCTDISAGMLDTLAENARRLGLDTVTTIRADAESLPFADQSFDLVLGHAVLHHLPDLERAFSEFQRVLRPGGRIAFAGEPSRVGDRVAQLPKRTAGALAPAWRGALRLAPAPDPLEDGGEHSHDHLLESKVDVHAFRPHELESLATRAGFEEVQVHGEELLANWFGWFNRGLECSADPEGIPMLWRRYAFHGYLLLQRVDELALESWLPPALFYNLLVTGRRGDA